MTQTEALKLARQLLWRYRHETPIGNQPHMICQEADEAFKHIDEALEQPERPTCFADWQDTHATDRGCGNCHLRTECRTGQPEQEPVAEIVNHGGYAHVDWKAGVKHPVGTKFYTTPPQRKPLTDEQIRSMEHEYIRRRDFARAIEAAHGIKEKNSA